MSKEFKKWFNENNYEKPLQDYSSEEGWNACKNKVLKMVKLTFRNCGGGYPSREDFNHLLDEINKL